MSRTCGGRWPAEGHAAARAPLPRPPGRGQPKKPRPAPLYEAKAVLEALQAERGQPIPWREAEGVVLRKQVGAVRVHGATGSAPLSPRPHRGAPGPEGWLRGERPVPGERGEVKWDCRTRSAATSLRRLGALAPSRWPIEPVYEEAKGAWGLDHYQGRRWDGRHRQRALVMLAYSFVTRQRWRPAMAAGFAPLWGAAVVAGRPSSGARVAVPRCRVMAHGNQPDHPCPPQADLTK